MKKLRIYVDTSVIGGCFDDEYSDESKELIEMAVRGEIVLLISDILMDELRLASERIQSVLEFIPNYCMEAVFSSDESIKLRDMYIAEDVIGKSSSIDAHHVAIATINSADVIVNWNFKHIVHIDKIRVFNSVNMREGYHNIEIRSPREVV